MSPTKALEIIRAAVVAANPEIMKLQFGCLIRPKNEEAKDVLYKWTWGDDKGEHEHFPMEVLWYEPSGETYEERELIEARLTIAFYDPFGGFVTRTDVIDWLGLDEAQPEDDLEIIGRPILPQDIVKILPHNWYMKWDEGAKRFDFVNMTSFATKSFKNEYITWRDAPLTEQAEAQVVLLASLLQSK